jgi:two-component system NtrC family response regulator
LKQGHTVKAAFSGEEAVQAAAEEPFDVAVVDLKMPGIDGVETQKRLRDVQPFLQCIVLTGHGSIESALESGHQEAFQYLLKPVDYDNLVAVIKEAHQKKVKLQEDKFQEELVDLTKRGLGAHGMRKAIAELRRIYGIE